MHDQGNNFMPSLLSSIQTAETAFQAPLYNKRDIALVCGEGCYLYDSTGKQYLDLASNIGTNILGYGHPTFTEVLVQQVQTLTNCHQSFYNDQRAAFLEAYAAVLPDNLNAITFSNSGAEAIEVAIKFTRGIGKKRTIISTKGAYHGRTLGALGATSSPKYQDPYKPLLDHFLHISYNDISALEQCIAENDDVAAVILEPIQGEGGIRIPDEDYLSSVRELCTRHGIIMILDEVQTGYRTGKLFAFEHSDIVPDILCLSKGIANGIPMGVTITTPDIAKQVPKGTHGSTFAGNPLSCAAATAVLRIFKNEQLDVHAEKVGNAICSALTEADCSLIRSVRGKGLMIGIELRERNTKYLRTFQERGFIALPAGSTIIRLLPPLTITQAQADQAVAVLLDVLR